jgi:hypothetical protein
VCLIGPSLAGRTFRAERRTDSYRRHKMASSGKRKTTFAKLAREQRVRERRLEKKARKDARRRGIEPDRERIAGGGLEPLDGDPTAPAASDPTAPAVSDPTAPAEDAATPARDPGLSTG